MQMTTVVGNIGKDPELRFTQSGRAVLNFSLAENRKGQEGQEDVTTWWDVTVWAPMAEPLANALEKGTYCTVTGRVDLRTWEKDGKQGAALRITADAVGWREKREGSGLPKAPAPMQHERAQAGSVQDDDDPFADQ